MTRTAHTFGIHLPPNEENPAGLRLADMAAMVERHEFESLWLSDHTVLVEEPRSRYPFSTDGAFFAPPETDWYDWVVTLSYLAATTSRVRLGVGVAVLPHRQPVVLAKQLATLDRLSGGRVAFGMGVGWLAEEFAALGIPFRERGARTDAALEVMRQVWTGAPAAGEYGPFTIPDGVHSMPTPVQPRPPVLVGGESPAALRRAAVRGDGWFGTIAGGRMPPAHLHQVVARLRDQRRAAGLDPATLDVTLRVAAGRDVSSPDFATYLADLLDAGATRLTFDLGWRSTSRAEEVLQRLRTLAADL